MEIHSKVRFIGRYSDSLMKLKVGLESGMDIAVATHNPKKFKDDFESIAGCCIALHPRGETNFLYTASLIK